MAKAACDIQVFVKPGGAVCNLECRYCYYLDKERLYPESKSFRMPDGLLRGYSSRAGFAGIYSLFADNPLTSSSGLITASRRQPRSIG